MIKSINTAKHYNAPIVTNTTLNTIKEPLSIKSNENAGWSFKIYPNPTKGDCIVSINNFNFMIFGTHKKFIIWELLTILT